METRVLVTGGTGTLGRHLVELLVERGHVPRVMSRSERPDDLPSGREWARAELATGDGVVRAVEDVDAVVHAASSTFRHDEVDVAGTREHLLPAVRRSGVRHVVFPSIVGIDEIPLGYYRAKREVERTLHAAEVATTVARATQFHALIHLLIRGAGKLPVVFLPTDVRLQTVDAREFAAYLVDLLEDGPRGRAPDFAGPEVRTLGDMTRAWADARGKRRWIVRLPVPGDVARAFREGRATNPGRAAGEMTWEAWLAGDRGPARTAPAVPG